MTEADLAAAADVFELAFPHARSGTDPETHLDRLREELARPWSHSWVARDPLHGVVGLVTVWLAADELHVIDVATHPAWRRQGIGALLVDAVVGFARVKRATRIMLEVRRSNEPARRLYAAAGFFDEGLRREYYPDGEDAIQMTLRLDPVTGAPVRSDER